MKEEKKDVFNPVLRNSINEALAAKPETKERTWEELIEAKNTITILIYQLANKILSILKLDIFKENLTQDKLDTVEVMKNQIKELFDQLDSVHEKISDKSGEVDLEDSDTALECYGIIMEVNVTAGEFHKSVTKFFASVLDDDYTARAIKEKILKLDETGDLKLTEEAQNQADEANKENTEDE